MWGYIYFIDLYILGKQKMFLDAEKRVYAQPFSYKIR